MLYDVGLGVAVTEENHARRPGCGQPHARDTLGIPGQLRCLVYYVSVLCCLICIVYVISTFLVYVFMCV